MLTRAGSDRCQVEPVSRTVTSVVPLESGLASLEEPYSSDTVTAGGMREGYTDPVSYTHLTLPTTPYV